VGLDPKNPARLGRQDDEELLTKDLRIADNPFLQILSLSDTNITKGGFRTRSSVLFSY
jgi:hypothetical protein